MADDILGFYQSKVSIRQSIVINDSKGQFKYFGFYKALFDFLVAPPPIAPDLIFLGQDMKTCRYQVAFKFDDGKEKKIDLTPKEYDAYIHLHSKISNKLLENWEKRIFNNLLENRQT